MLEDKPSQGNFEEITDKADAPLEDALALMVRERLTGMPIRPRAHKDRRHVARVIEEARPART
jgi:cobaltochelatase CobT